ncbi:MAG: MFS transporter, partial [Acidimicrobiales bacterium]
MSSVARTTTSAISRGTTLLLAVACGLSVANLYYAQPLLSTVARSLHTGAATAASTVTLSQVGYAVGLALLVPAGDVVDRRRLVPAVLLVTAVALLGSAAAPSIGVLVVLAVAVGMGSVAAQILVPLAASLATDAERGRVVGTVMSGLLLGILLARTAAGLVAGASSWRVVYVAAAVAVVALAAVLAKALPAEHPRPRIGYGALLRSTLSLFAAERVLRRRALLGGLGFAAFSVFWTTMAFLLARPPYGYSDTVIGLFGLVGAAGALSASAAGRLTDRGRARATTVGFAVSIAVSYALLWLGRSSLAALIAGIL